MTELLYKTRSGGSPERKPRVYFTCHPADKERSLDKLCKDIFASSDCAVFYTEDMADRLPEETRETDLERMNLFVIPVSLKLLLEPNRAMDEDFPFAREKHIPVLPIMLEPGLDLVYSREDKFGNLQYLDPDAVDPTAIPYSEKLKKYLNSTLFDSETVERIQAAFDAYIFLSYRKKDRKQANELMRLIHADPKCRDIAVWFDEFLTPGESFTETIREAMARSKAFTLLVTPSLLELNDRGEPNYVQATEYPEAKALAAKKEKQQERLEFLPAELPAEEASLTDRTALFRDFAELPDPMNLNSEEERELFLERLRKLAAEERKDDPTHNYLIGLAYLDGIDVEIDRERGLELITAAGEAELPEAMEKLYHIYSEENVNFRQATRWAERISAFLCREMGEKHPGTIAAMHRSGLSYLESGDYRNSLELLSKAYELSHAEKGEEDPSTLACMSSLALVYSISGNYKKALELTERSYELYRAILGIADYRTIIALNNLATACLESGDNEKALEKLDECWRSYNEANGAHDRVALTIMRNLAMAYSGIGEPRKALELEDRVYSLSSEILGDDHPDTLLTLNNMAVSYLKISEPRKALELLERVYPQFCKLLGREHPYTRACQSNLTSVNWTIGNRKKAVGLFVDDVVLYALESRHELPFLVKIERNSLVQGKEPAFFRFVRWLRLNILKWRIPFYPSLSILALCVLHILSGYKVVSRLFPCPIICDCMLGQLVFQLITSSLMPVVYLLLERVGRRKKSLLPMVCALASAGVGFLAAWTVAGIQYFIADSIHIIFLLLPFYISAIGWLITLLVEILLVRLENMTNQPVS